MRKNFVVTALIIIQSLLINSTTLLYSAPSGNIQLAIASPDPVTAGEKLTFQVIALNTGAEAWNAGDYYIEIEIYNSAKTYIKKIDRVTGKVKVSAGETSLMYIPFSVPTLFDGDYFYKVNLTVKQQRVIVSEYFGFSVIPLSQAPKPISKITVGGNAILSWKQTQRKYDIYGSSDDYNGSFNLNLIGKAYETPLSLNLYALYTKADQWSLDNFLFNYYGKTIAVAFGDIQPSFNSLVIYGAGVRGLNVTATDKQFSISAIGAESAKSVEGTASTNGTYERYLLGGEVKQNLSVMNACLAASYANSKDDRGSLDMPGPSLAAVKNNVAGANGYFEILEKLGLKGEYARSEYLQNVSVSSDSVADTGIKATASLLNFDNLTMSGVYSKINPDFNSLSSPSSTKDKESYEVSTNYSIPNWTSVSVYFNKYSDNLKKDPNKTTSTQNIGSASITLQRPNYPMLTVGYSLNQAVGSPKTALNNETNTPSLSLSHTFKMTTASLSVQRSKFSDKTNVSDNLKTDSGNLGLSTHLGRDFSFSAGATFSKVFNLVSSTATTTGSYSVSMNIGNIIKDKLSSAIWGSYTASKDNPKQNTDTKNLTGTAELTYNIRQDLSATVGYTYASNKDNFTDSQSYKENTGNIRFSMSF